MSRPLDSPGRRLISRLERFDRGFGAGQTVLVVVGIVMVLAVGGLILANLDPGGGTVYVGLAMLVAVGALVGALLRRSRRSLRAMAGREGVDAMDVAGQGNARLRHRLSTEEVAAACRRREEGFEWEDICRLVVPAYAWWSPAEKLVFRNHLEGEVSRTP